MQCAVLDSVQEAGTDREWLLTERAAELGRRLGNAIPRILGQLRDYRAKFGHPAGVADDELSVRAGGAKLGVSIAPDLATSGERQHPELAGSNQVRR